MGIFGLDSMHCGPMPFEHEIIANFLSALLTLDPLMNQLFVVSKFGISSKTTLAFVTFLCSSSFVFHYNVFFHGLWGFEHFFTMWTVPCFPLGFVDRHEFFVVYILNVS